jgi:NhaA family Na+:H+ antiporter
MSLELKNSPLAPIHGFLKLESASGILLVIAGIIAMIAANTPLVGVYQGLLDLPIKIQVGSFILDKSLLIWVNDLLMAIFFLLIGLEIKREVVSGELSDPSRVALPAIAALGGMLIPVAFYASVNWGDPDGMQGWAIPAATDIAFALGLLSLFGKRVPVGLKIFLMTLAVIDDLGAIIIIALFYSGDLSLVALGWAAGAIALLVVLNRRGVTNIGAYILVGIALWVFVLKSGVHATLAGVITALMIPASDPKDPDHSPVQRLEHALHPWVAYGILPLFAFANAGVRLEGIRFSDLLQPIPLGIMMGLVIGKQVGVFTFSWLAVKAGLARLPSGVSFKQVYAASLLTGIGFTMSLFISMLAFENTASGEVVVMDRPGILLGSLVSAVLGYIALNFVLPRGKEPDRSVG